MLIIALAALSLTAFAHDHSSGHTLVRLSASTEVKDYLRSQGADIFGVNIKENTIEAYLSNEQMVELRSLKAPFHFVIPNTLLRGPDPEYMTSAEVEARLRDYAARFPDLAEVSKMGDSLEGRSIWAIKISDQVTQRDLTEPVAWSDHGYRGLSSHQLQFWSNRTPVGRQQRDLGCADVQRRW